MKFPGLLTSLRLVTPLPKGPPPSSVANNRPIFITSVLSKVFERLVSVRLGRFIERSGVLPTTQFAYRKSLGSCDAFCVCVTYTAKCIGEWQDSRIVQIDFSAAFDRVNHQGILYKLCSVGIGGSVLSILTVPIQSITACYFFKRVNFINTSNQILKAHR